MDFFNDHAVAFALVCAGVAVGFGLYFTWWLLKQPAGSERMQEIARAVQEGAAAYLRRQYTTIAAVALVPFLAIEALRALVPVLSGSVPPELTRDFEQVIANLQLAYASAVEPAS